MMTPIDELGLDAAKLGSREQQRKNVREKLMRTLRKAAGQVPFAQDVLAGYFCATDPGTPVKVRYALLATLAYFVLPIDVVPDVLVGVGFGDDAAVLLYTLNLLQSHIQDKHRRTARKSLEVGTLQE